MEYLSTMIVQSDGKILVGGSFTAAQEVSRRGIARLNLDGTLDTSFDPGTEFSGGGNFSAMLVQPDRKILIAGGFDHFNGTPLNGLARLNPDGSLDTTFDASAGRMCFRAMALANDDKVVVGGCGIARLNPNGSLDQSFNSAERTYMDHIASIAVQPDGKVIIGGDFCDTCFPSSVPLNRVARLNHDNSRGSTIEFPTSGTTVSESDGKAILTVERNGDATGTATVDYVTSGGTAQAGLDYAATSGTLVFGPSETSKTFAVPILDDGVAESDETVNLTLTNPTGDASLSPQKSTVLIILDNERPGSLDSSFRGIGCGVCFFTFLTPQENGKTLVVNSYGGSLSRFDPEGSWDGSFADYVYGGATAVQADGRILVGGTFTNINGFVCRGLARLTVDGAIDTTFDAGSGPSPLRFGSACSPSDPFLFSDSAVTTIALQADGKILIGGGFSDVGGFPRSGLARLNPDGSVDPSFDVGIEGDFFHRPRFLCSRLVNAVAVQPDGKVLVSGSFSKITGVPRSGFARLNPDGSLDSTFAPAIEDRPGLPVLRRLFGLQTDGKILVAFYASGNGQFGEYVLARFNSNGSRDTGFNTRTAVMDDQGIGGIPIYALAIQRDGKILIGGSFDTINGVERKGIARLNTDGSLDTTFQPPKPPTSGDYSPVSFLALGATGLALQPDGQILVAAGHQIFRLNGDSPARKVEFSSRSYSVSEKGSGAVVTVRRRGDTSIAASVDYKTRDDSAKAGLDYIAQRGTVNFVPFEIAKTLTIPVADNGRVEEDRTFEVILENPSDGSILGLSRTSEVTILDNERPGSLDPDFRPAPELSNLSPGLAAAVPQPDGTILLIGWTSQSGEQSRIIRFSADGFVRSSVPAPLNAAVSSAALQPDGKVVLGGFFETLNGVARHLLARLNPDGSLDSGYNPGATVNIGDGVSSVLLQQDGKVLVGGYASPENPGVMVARLNGDGSLDTSFNPKLTQGAPYGSGVSAMALQPDGKILIVGSFASVNGISRNAIARLNPDGSLDPGFDPGTGAISESEDGRLFPNAYFVMVLGDGKILITGGFTVVNSVKRPGMARLYADGSLDPNFNPSLSPSFGGSVLVQPDGKLLLEGAVELVRLNGDGSYIKLSLPTLASQSPLRLRIPSQPGKNYVLQASTNLIDWLPLATNAAIGSRLEFQDAGAAKFALRFYRATAP